jgi:hypothetical protein
MRSELAEHVATYLDAVAPPITLDEVRRAPVDVDLTDDLDTDPAGSGRAPTGRSTTRRRLAVVAVAASIVLVAALAVTLGRTDESTSVDVGADPGPPSSSPDATDAAWLTPFGPESVAPPVPHGWTVMDFEDLRFAVPGDWSVPISRSCLIVNDGAPPGAVLLPQLDTATACEPEIAVPASLLWIERVDLAPEAVRGGVPTTIGTLAAAVEPPDARCGGCPPVYLLDAGFAVSVRGSNADAAVLATFTDSGARRALQEGPVAGRDGWSPVEYGGVGLEVPPDWTFVDLPGSYTESTTANGGRRTSGMPAPGQCSGWAMFGPAGQMSVGETLMHGSCPAPLRIDLAPGNGAWIRPIADDQIAGLGTAITSGEIGGLDVTVVDLAPDQRQHPTPAIDLIVRTPASALWLTVGSGTDASLVRSILRSLRAA